MSLKFYDASKVLLYVKQLEAKTPVFIELHPSLACNHKCVWCRYGHDNSKVTLEYVEQLMHSYPEVKGVRITGGGEPLSNKHTISIIRFLSTTGRVVGIETNGGLLDEFSINIIAQYCRYCRISLDAATPETHEKLHGSRDFNKIVQSIFELRAAGIKELGVSFLVVPENVDEIPALAELRLPVNYFHFKPLIQGIDHVTRGKAIKHLDRLVYEGYKMRFDRLRMDDISYPEIPCYISGLIRVIGGDSKEYVCCEKAYEPDFEVGIWNGDNSKCTSCRYSNYNDVLDGYYKNTFCKELL